MPIYLRQPIAASVLLCAMLAIPGNAVAQTAGPKPITIGERIAAVRFSPAAAKPDRSARKSFGIRQAAQPGARRDSLKNGAVIGAIVGAVALGGFGAAICHALREPSDPGCLAGTLRIAAAGAAIGAGAGLAVDAAMTHNTGARVAVRIRF
jgi:hypothetical protein